MQKSAWDQITPLYTLPTTDQHSVSQFRYLHSSQASHTRDEGNPHHYCVFFLPIHRSSSSIYLGHHKKANDWIPPGGHIDQGESPTDTAIREMKEELNHTIVSDQLTPFSLSVKEINRPELGCQAHYDIWYLVEMENMINFQYLTDEYHDAGWFTLKDGIAKIKYNPDFAQIISRLDMLL